jgi:hypothetical protein
VSFVPPPQRGVTPQHAGRFPGFDTLDQIKYWDHATAGVVLERLAVATTLAFFTAEEVAVARPLLDQLLGQDGEPRVPVLELIDTRLARGETDGWHYDDLPEDAEAWRTSLAHLDDDARTAYAAGFGELTTSQQAQLISAVQELSDAGKAWHGWSAKHVWSLWTRYACTAFYSHPWAWSEIGFGGPAYPRGYLNAGVDAREKWEVADATNSDPVPFADRAEQARAAHGRLVGPTDT